MDNLGLAGTIAICQAFPFRTFEMESEVIGKFGVVMKKLSKA